MEDQHRTKEELIEELRIHQIELEMQNHELRRVQHELEFARDSYSDLFEFSPVGYVTLSSKGAILKANLTAASLLGLERSRLISEMFSRFILKDDADIFYLHRNKVLETSEKQACDLRMVKKDGNQFQARLEFGTTSDSPTQPGQLRVVIIDYTEPKRLEEELQYHQYHLEELIQQRTRDLFEVQDKFKFMAESMVDIVWMMDMDLRVTYISPSVERILGYSPEERQGKSLDDILAPESLKKMHQTYADEIQKDREGTADPNRIITLVAQYFKKDGSTIWLENKVRGIRDSNGALAGFHGLSRDVTERVKAQEAQMRLTTAIEQAYEGIVILDSQGTIEYVNSGYEHISGFARHEVIGQKYHLFEPQDHEVSFYVSVQEGLLKDSGWSGRVPRNRKDGTPYVEEIRLSPVYNDAGKIVNYVAIKRDVSQEISMERQLLQAQKMEAVGTLAGGIAHDFNNILQVVLGYSELLLAGRKKTDKEFSALEKIHSASRRGADLVQNLMVFSRKVEPYLKPLNLNDEVAQIERLLLPTIPKDIKITLATSGDLRLVEADVSQIGQVLMNLAVNARDAMPDGGELNFETSNVELEEEYCSNHPGSQPGTYVLLAVSDTGTGMTEETLSHIFEPFFTTKGVGHGTGLGLATVYGIVKQHRGYITCESEMGKGTCFKIYLPAIEKDLQDEAQECNAPLVGGTETILLVDDEEYLRDLGAAILQRYGYDVITAENGQEALGTYLEGRERISLVILDIVMPEMDGKKCLVEILKINPNAKVLVASGHSETSPSKPRLLPGAKGLVIKPYEMRKLIHTVREVLDASG